MCDDSGKSKAQAADGLPKWRAAFKLRILGEINEIYD